MRQFLLALALVACKGEGPNDPTGEPNPTDEPSPTDEPQATPPPCGALIANTNPVADANGVAIDSPINVQFNAAITDADHWHLAVTGVSGTATLAPDGMSAEFVPDAPLEYETTYAIEAEVCDDGGLYLFSTADAPLLDDDIEGKTYAIPYNNVVFAAPPNQLMNTLVTDPVDSILLQIIDIDDTTRIFTANAGAAVDINGIPVVDCPLSFDAGTGDFTNLPMLEVGPTLYTLPFAGQNVTIEDMEISGTMGIDGDSITDLSITGRIDTRGITGFGDICFLAGLAGVNCIQCADGLPRCLNVNASAAQADWDPNLDIQSCFTP